MSDDLMNRLMDAYSFNGDPLLKEAADRIEKMEKPLDQITKLMLEVERLRSVLRDLHEACDCWNAVQEREKARKAIRCDTVS